MSQRRRGIRVSSQLAANRNLWRIVYNFFANIGHTLRNLVVSPFRNKSQYSASCENISLSGGVSVDSDSLSVKSGGSFIGALSYKDLRDLSPGPRASRRRKRDSIKRRDSFKRTLGTVSE